MARKKGPKAPKTNVSGDPLRRELTRARTGDGLSRLRASRLLAVQVERLERDAWAACRAEGLSWADIAEGIGLTRSGAQSRGNKLMAKSYRGTVRPPQGRPRVGGAT